MRLQLHLKLTVRAAGYFAHHRRPPCLTLMPGGGARCGEWPVGCRRRTWRAAVGPSITATVAQTSYSCARRSTAVLPGPQSVVDNRNNNNNNATILLIVPADSYTGFGSSRSDETYKKKKNKQITINVEAAGFFFFLLAKILVLRKTIRGWEKLGEITKLEHII